MIPCTCAAEGSAGTLLLPYKQVNGNMQRADCGVRWFGAVFLGYLRYLYSQKDLFMSLIVLCTYEIKILVKEGSSTLKGQPELLTSWDRI